jgi:predicted ferric reductase
MVIAYLLYITGVFAIVLGTLHFFFPVLFDYDGAVPLNGAPLKPFRLGLIRYNTQRSDVRGIVWVMNHFVSYNLVAYGLIDLFWQTWLPTQFGVIVCLWMAGGWFVRAASQLYLGRRTGDWLILAGFALVGLVHVAVALAHLA